MGGASSKQHQPASEDDTLAAATTKEPAAAAAAADDKLKDGPCADVYALLEKCKQERRIIRHDRALTACVSETDLLIKCIHRNPAYFKKK